MIERATGWRDDARGSAALRRAVAFLLVMVGWVPFRAADLHQAGVFLEAMFIPDMSGLPASMSEAATNRATLTLVLAATVVLLPRAWVTGRYLEAARSRVAVGARVAVSAIGAPYAAILVAAGTFSPFLYYQF